MKKVLLIYNPHAGNGVFTVHLDMVVAAFAKKGFLVVPVRLGGRIEPDTAFKELHMEQYHKVIAAGGDGTISNVVSAMIRNDIHLPLAIFPAGTANDLAAYFEIPLAVEDMLRIALTDKYTPMDVGKAGDRYFVNVLAAGMLVDISQKTDPAFKNTLGIASYYLKGLATIPQYRNIPLRVKSEGRDIHTKATAILVMNGRSAGGFKNVSPDSEISDGLLDVVLFKDILFPELLPTMMGILTGLHTESKKVEYFKTRHLWIEAENGDEVLTDVDGERGDPLPLEVSVLPSRLLINIGDISETDSKKLSEMDVLDLGNIKVSIRDTDDYAELVELFIRNDLEYTEDDEVTTDLVRCLRAETESGELVGGCVLALREGRFICDGIAVDPPYRGSDTGARMLAMIEDSAMDKGAEELYLVARAPAFFAKYGYREIPREEAPTFFECFTCPQYGETCFPKVMKKTFN
jgi:YegS/Rv2252/BmrU family lipid kinase